MTPISEAEGELHSVTCVQAWRIEQGDRTVLGADENVDLGAPEQDALGAAVGHVQHDPPVLLTRAVADDSDAELVVDDAHRGFRCQQRRREVRLAPPLGGAGPREPFGALTSGNLAARCARRASAATVTP